MYIYTYTYTWNLPILICAHRICLGKTSRRDYLATWYILYRREGGNGGRRFRRGWQGEGARYRPSAWTNPKKKKKKNATSPLFIKAILSHYIVAVPVSSCYWNIYFFLFLSFSLSLSSCSRLFFRWRDVSIFFSDIYFREDSLESIEKIEGEGFICVCVTFCE